MAITVVQSASAGGASTATFGANVTALNSVLMLLYAYGTTGGFSYSSPEFGGSPATAETLVQQDSETGSASVWLAAVLMNDLPGGAATVSATLAENAAGIIAYEINPGGGTLTLDPGGGVSSAQGTGTALSSGSTPAIQQAPEGIFGAGVGYAVAVTGPSSPWSAPINVFSNFCCASYQIVTSSGGTYDWTATGSPSGNWSAAVVALYAAASGSNVSAQLATALAPPATAMQGRETISGHLGTALAPNALAVHANVKQNVSAQLAASLAPMAIAMRQPGAGLKSAPQQGESDRPGLLRKAWLW